MVNEEIVGTDVDVNWELTAEGDLSTVSAGDNMAQAIFLRLSSYLNSLWWCYLDYGSKAKDWLGKNQNSYNRSTLINEVYKTVLKDPRVNSAFIEVVDWNSTYIGIRVNVMVLNRNYEEYFIFGNIPRKNEHVYHSDYKNTHIDLMSEYYVRPGQILRVHCHVLDDEDKRVPIGEVELRIGKYQIKTMKNPQEIAQSGAQGRTENTFEPGSNTFEFRVPKFIAYGEHDLIAYYKGIRGYNSSTAKAKLHVVDRIPTSIHYIYPRKNYKYYYANDVDEFTTPKTFIVDYNKSLVDHGEVRYYLDEGELKDGYSVIDYPMIFLDGVLLHEEVYIKTKEAILDCSNNFVFELNRMFHTKDRITLQCADGKVVDYLEVNYRYGIYFLTSVDLIFKSPHYTENSNIILQVIE